MRLLVLLVVLAGCSGTVDREAGVAGDEDLGAGGASSAEPRCRLLEVTPDWHPCEPALPYDCGEDPRSPSINCEYVKSAGYYCCVADPN